MVELLAVHLPWSRLDNPVTFGTRFILYEDDMPCSWRTTPRWFLWLVMLGAIHVPAIALAQTQNLNLAWSSSPGLPPASYHVHVGTSPGTYNVLVQPVPGTQTTYAFAASPGVRYYFAVQAVSAAGVASPMSDEVSGGVPTFAQLANRSGIVGSAIAAFLPEVSDPDGGTLSFTATGLPPGLAINGSTGRITGIPLSAGATTVTISVFDGTVTVQRSFTWTISGPVPPSVSAVSVAPGSGAGATQRFVLQYSDSVGAVDLDSVAVRFGASSATLVDACAISFNRASGVISLLDDDGRTWMAASFGSGTLQNTQCGVALATSSAAVSGNALTLTLAMTFDGSFAGAKNIYMQATSAQGADSGWQNRGTWTVPAAETTIPALSITSHSDNQSVSTASITVSGTATDGGVGNSGITGVTVNGSAASGGTASGAGTANWSRTLSLSAGANVITVVATDGAGNSRQRQITVTRSVPDATPPAVTITSHSNNQTVSAASITLSGTATDSGLGGSGISSVTVNGVAASGGSATGSGTASWSRTVALNAGNNQLTVVARDGAGNTRQAQLTVIRSVPDTALPALSITSHSNNQTVTAASITLSGTASDSGAGGSGISSVTVNGVAASGGSAAGSGTANWSRTVTLNTGSNLLTVVASDGAGNARQVQITVVSGQAAAALSAGSVSPSGGSGMTQTFALEYVDTLGSTDIATAWVWVSASSAGTSANSCLLYYERARNLVYQLDDAGAVWTPGTAGSTTTLQNSQCSVRLAGVSVATSGTSLVLTLPLTFRPSFAGTKNVYLYAANPAGVNSSWQDRGDWTVPASGPPPPSTPGVAVAADWAQPNSGAGVSQTFSLRYSDSLGATNLDATWVWFTADAGSSSANSCLAYYRRPTNTLLLLDDSGTVWQSAAVGTSALLQNSQCALSVGSSTVDVSGNALTLNLAVSFKAAYAGTKNLYMFASSATGTNTGWVDRGDWTVTSAASGVPTADLVTPGSGIGSASTFALRYSASAGATRLNNMWVWFTAAYGAVSTDSCLAYYNRSANAVSLLSDDGTTWISGELGTLRTLQNSQCAIALRTSSAAASGPSITVNLAMSFRARYAGAKDVYMYADTTAGLNSGWHDRGNWTVR